MVGGSQRKQLYKTKAVVREEVLRFNFPEIFFKYYIKHCGHVMYLFLKGFYILIYFDNKQINPVPKFFSCNGLVQNDIFVSTQDE